MMCARCDQPIRDGEDWEPYDNMSPTGAGSTVFLHKKLCKRPPTQTAPASKTRLIRH